MKLGLGIITAGGWANFVPSGFCWSLYALHSEILTGKLNDRLTGDPITSMELCRSHRFPTDVARNDICRQALEKNIDVLFFLDADHTFMPEAFAAVLDVGEPIATGRYHVKAPPFHPTLYLAPKQADPGQFKAVHYGRGIFPVDRCGAGALAIRREVLETLGDPWFEYMRDVRPPHDRGVTEDFYFCEKAQQHGYTIWANWDATFDHIAVVPVTEDHRKVCLDEMEQGISSGREDLVDALVVCGYPDGYQLPSGQTVKNYTDKPVGVV